MKKKNRLRIVPKKRFAETRSHWRNPMFRGLGKRPNKQNEQSGIWPDCSFWQNFMKFAQLAKVIPNSG